MGVEQAMYTPKDLKSEYLPVGDHPFGATLFLKSFLIATDSVKKQRLASTFSAGVLGPSAQADDLQKGAHVILNDVVPPGWKYQVKNDAIIKYQVNYQKQLLHHGNIFSLDVEGIAKAGTLNDKAGIGANLLIGYFESPFAGNTTPRRKFHIYVYDHPEVDIVGYDATMEGGVFDRGSPYVIPAKNITTVTYQNRAGLVIVYKRINLEYDECFQSPQFTDGPFHGYGGIGLGVALD